ncbi:hypothetical protein BEWA_040730 [Theileria equi strain WA]|uniref:Uncharacterized protein n=1 Tax=Theileria equi strain WA TaxID=1537102 RepID=L1LFK3_THEEQ|nr:hypothetical protein BEWA_040730 [Theileria equi strain WA]EKX74035.1 hypothetical protein BEWA_040730 [Theileria equi strain WA]|eukprot:XP_004833487.1 hypothetical protein BEWA_040730 [Theileria equi strain WA]
MLHYQQTILSIVESGQARKLNLFVHFDVGTNPQDTDGILAEFNKSLYDVFKGRHSADVAKQLSFNPISVPSGIQLIKHLLGANGTQLESFEEVIKRYLFISKCKTISPELIIDSVEKHTESKDNLGIENVLEILEGINRFKMQLAAKRLEDDVKNLLAVSKK